MLLFATRGGTQLGLLNPLVGARTALAWREGSRWRVVRVIFNY